MLERLSVAPISSLVATMLGSRRRRACSEVVGTALAIVLAVCAGPIVAPPAKALADGAQDPTEPSIQYRESLAHDSGSYSFTPGGVVTVPFEPRAGDSRLVDGALPVALPGAIAPALAQAYAAPSGTINSLRRQVFGFMPYWELGSTLDYDTISTIAYFGVNLQPDGTLLQSDNGWSGWVSSTATTMINDAHSHGTRVVLTVESFAWDSGGAAAQAAILSSPTISGAAAQRIAAEVSRRGVDGVDLDFEPIASGQRSNFVAFVRLVRGELDKINPGYELTFCATGRPTTYLLPALLADGAADAVFVMGYNLLGGSPAKVASIDPLTSTVTGYDLTDTVNAYLAQVPSSKVILGLPWYGAAWSTGTNHGLNPAPVSAVTYGKPVEAPYSTAQALAATADSTHLGKFYDPAEQTAWTAYYGTFDVSTGHPGLPTWREFYFDDSQALGAKCDAIDGWDLRGVGIWALGYDNNNGNGDLTATIATKFETGIAGTTFHPVTPTRLVDTRLKKGITSKLSANAPRAFQVVGIGPVLAGATAVTGNVTVTGSTGGWAVYLGPYSVAKPSSSTVNFAAGQVVANGVTVALSADGKLSATYMGGSGATTDLVFDVTGYFTPDTTGQTYHPMTPVRVVDSRLHKGLAAKLPANTPKAFMVWGIGGVPSGARAVTGNVTVTGSSGGWAVYVGPDPVAKPTTSTVNFKRGEVVANNLTVALSATGTLIATFMASKGTTTDLVFDVTGYYTADDTGLRFVPVTPARLLDSRVGNGLSGKLYAAKPRPFQIGGRVSVPSGARAISGIVTVVNSTGGWAIFVGPGPIAKPPTSTLNFTRGQVRANGLTVALGTSGTLSPTYLSSSGNKTDLVLDVTGYYVP